MDWGLAAEVDWGWAVEAVWALAVGLEVWAVVGLGRRVGRRRSPPPPKALARH